MVKSSLLSLLLGLLATVKGQDFQVINFHSEFERAHFDDTSNSLARLLMADATTRHHDYIAFHDELNTYLKGLQSKQSKFKRKKDFISHVFYKTHRKYLKRYTPHTSLVTLSKTGRYDCLSATSLYSYLFSTLSISHKIIETNYHIYIVIDTEEGKILLESTDPIYGFVDDKDEIQSRLDDMDLKESKANDSYTFAATVKEEISPVQLIGLQYYNAAVKAFNDQQYEVSIDLLAKGIIFRSNSRTMEFALVIAQGIMQNESLNQKTKISHVNKLQRILQSGSAVVASR
ncbi:MAG: hypothetical protein AAF519_09360 [Bacteroidota bacterium]